VAPPNAKLNDFISTSSIQVTWDGLHEDDVNGILQGFKLKYRVLQTSGKPAKDAKEKLELTVGADKRSFSLGNLISYSRYEIRLAAFTSVGDGPWVTLVGGTMVLLRVGTEK